MRRLVDYNPTNGVSTYHHYDADTDSTYIEYVQDPSKFIEHNKKVQNHSQGGAKGMNELFRKGVKDSWAWVASIPPVIQYKWLVEDGINIHDKNHWDRVKRKLNDPDWKYLRTGTGRL